MNELIRIVRQIKNIKKIQEILDIEIDDLSIEFLKYNGIDDIYDDGDVTIYPREDINYLRLNIDSLKQILIKYLNNDIVNEILNESKTKVTKTGGITIKFKNN